jgi:hypothetical protein
MLQLKSLLSPVMSNSASANGSASEVDTLAIRESLLESIREAVRELHEKKQELVRLQCALFELVQFGTMHVLYRNSECTGKLHVRFVARNN